MYSIIIFAFILAIINVYMDIYDIHFFNHTHYYRLYPHIRTFIVTLIVFMVFFKHLSNYPFSKWFIIALFVYYVYYIMTHIDWFVQVR